MVIDEVTEGLLKPKYLWTRSEALTRPCPVPQKPGIYAWYFEEVPPRVPVAGCNTWLGKTLLYIGIAPSRESSKRNLAKRMREHYKGNAYGSTLRKSLGCLLGKQLCIRLQQVGSSGKRINFAEGEDILSEWMDDNAFVTWVVQEEPWVYEGLIIKQLNLPLNMKGNEDHPFFSTLSQIRKECRQATG